MTWTYGGDPTANDRDAVRFYMGDTDTTDQLVTDEEIAFLLAQYDDDALRAAAAACDALANKFAREVTKSGDGLSISSGERHRQFAQRADALRKQQKEQRRAATPFAGGISSIDKETREDDTDRIGTAITLDWDKNPRHPWGSSDEDRLTS